MRDFAIRRPGKGRAPWAAGLIALAATLPCGLAAVSATESSLTLVGSDPTLQTATDADPAWYDADGIALATDSVELTSFNEAAPPRTGESEASSQSSSDAALPEVAPVDSATLEMEQIEAARDIAALRVYRPITQITIDASLPAGELPNQTRDEMAVPRDVTPRFGDSRLMGGWAEQGYQWSATRLCHGPLYFEEVNLERYGYQCRPCLQPFVSGAHFFLTVPALPYKMTVHPPSECIYTLGHYRPGNRVPWRRNLPPWDARAAAVEASVAVGLIFLIP